MPKCPKGLRRAAKTTWSRTNTSDDKNSFLVEAYAGWKGPSLTKECLCLN